MAELRSFEPSDVPLIQALLAAIGWEAQYIEGQTASLSALHGDPNARVVVALAGAALAGFVSVAFAPWNRLGQVHGLAVAPVQQRRGIASALLGAAEAFVREQCGRGVFVDTPVDNHTARAFYTANGYQAAYVMPEYYAEGLDGVTYLKLFGRKPTTPSGDGP